MTKNMSCFLKRLSKNKELAEKARQMDQAQLLALAKELGLPLNEGDFTPPSEELSENELNSVAGGYFVCNCNKGGSGYETIDEAPVCSYVANAVDMDWNTLFPDVVCQVAGHMDSPKYDEPT